MLLQENRYGMKCLNPNQNENTWVSKTDGKLAILDYCINPDNMKSEVVLFPVARNQCVLCVVKMNQEVTFRRQLIVRSNQSCVDVVENVVSNHGRFCDLRSSFLDVSIRNEVITSNKNIPLQSPVCNEAYLFFYIYWVIYNLFYTECNSYDWSRTIIDWSRRVQCNDLSAINCGSRSKFII